MALFNDTGRSGHYGCKAVMASIAGLFAANGLAMVYRHPAGRDWRDDPAALAAIAAADLVVVNGEGTIHHSAPAGQRLAALGPFARALGKPVFLINATLEQNDAAIVADLRAFDHIWVRESASALWLAAHDIGCSRCPDLSLLQDLAPGGQRRGPTIVVDSVRRAASQSLARMALDLRASFVTMNRSADGQCYGVTWDRIATTDLDEIRRAPLFACPGFPAYARFLGTHDRMITGRFHAVCFALVLGLPFHALRSNTGKIEAVLADAGLSADRMLPEPVAQVPDHAPFTRAEQDNLAGYVADARSGAWQLGQRLAE